MLDNWKPMPATVSTDTQKFLDKEGQRHDDVLIVAVTANVSRWEVTGRQIRSSAR